MTTIPLADVEARLSAVLDDVSRTHERVVVTRNGRPEAVILSVDDLAAIEETLAVLSTPGLRDELDTASAEIDSGEWVGRNELARRYLHGQTTPTTFGWRRVPNGRSPGFPRRRLRPSWSSHSDRSERTPNGSESRSSVSRPDGGAPVGALIA